jgi:methionyl-tRNA formyltransferase
VADDDDATSLLAKVLPLGEQLLVESLAKIAAGEPGEPQDESAATYAPRLEESWREVDWTQPARTVHNQVRCWDGIFGEPHGAFAEIGGERFLVTRTRLLPGGSASGSQPGTVLQQGGDGLVIQCGDGPIAIIERQPAPA